MAGKAMSVARGRSREVARGRVGLCGVALRWGERLGPPTPERPRSRSHGTCQGATVRFEVTKITFKRSRPSNCLYPSAVTWLVPVVLLGLAIAVVAIVSMTSRRRRAEPPVQQSAQPRILIHSINDDRCTGCDACVAVCPTNVLDLVANKSRVLRFQDCIQCEACMWACPTEALVMHLEGTEAPALKVPELDGFYQTAIPGQYLIGEVAGKPLVKNAANIGRAVIEHMLQTGLGGGAGGQGTFDVAIVGSGPGGLSAALSCIHRGLSYIVLEKEQIIASTVARYPKGKLVMAEPYDTQNLSFLPVFDSSKETLIPIWQELIRETGLQIKLGEAVEAVERAQNGIFSIRTTVSSYKAQRLILATGTRGKPRTLQVPGENLRKVCNLLEDPDEHQGKNVIVIGGGDSAVEAALALADAGAKVILSYRGRAFSRAAAKNKQTVEAYAAERRIKVKLQSQVVSFEENTVTIQMADGSQKRYPNEAGFVLIGSDPPVKWLEKMGIRFVERPHRHSLGKTDEFVARLSGGIAQPCPEDAGTAAQQVLGHRRPAAPMDVADSFGAFDRALAELAEPVSGPRKWIRSASNLFNTPGKKLDRPMPLEEFARRARTHTGHGRRDLLDASERTRVLRMLRDEGGRLADEDSQVYIIAPAKPDGFMLDSGVEVSSPRAAPMYSPASSRGPSRASAAALDGEPKEAVIVGLARAMAAGPQRGGRSAPPPAPRPQPAAPPDRSKRPSARPEFTEEATRQVDAQSALADLLKKSRARPMSDFSDGREEATRAVNLDVDAIMSSADPTGMVRIESVDGAIELDDLFPSHYDESTRAVDVSKIAKLDAENRKAPRRPGTSDEDETRAIDIGRADSLSDVDFDLD